MPQYPASHVADILLPFAKISVVELAQAFDELGDYIISAFSTFTNSRSTRCLTFTARSSTKSECE